MVDPISIVSLLEGSISLIIQCGSAIKSLNEIAAKYKQAELTLSSIIQEMDVIELAWKRIKDWFESYTNEAGDIELLERLDKSLKCGTNVISALQVDLLDYGSMSLGFMQRSRLSWNEKALRDHQDRIRGQVQAMSLLLQVIELPTPKARSKQLETAQIALLKSDESAYSIVPSRMSISSSARDSVFSVESAELIRHRWDFEGDLLGARVYKRNYAKNLINSVLRSKVPKATDGAFTMLANDAVSTTAKDQLEASATEDDAPKTDVEQVLVLLSEERSDNSNDDGGGVWLDFVVIPDLIGEPMRTWTRSQRGKSWLEDPLLTELISMRIFAFKYPSHLLFTEMKIYAEKLLSDLKTAGAGKDNHRIFFIVDGFGNRLGQWALGLAVHNLRHWDLVRNILVFCWFDAYGYCGAPPFTFRSLVELYLKRLHYTPFGFKDLEDLYLKCLHDTTWEEARRKLPKTHHADTRDVSMITNAFNCDEKMYAYISNPKIEAIECREQNALMSIGKIVSATTKSLSSYRLILYPI